jgi:hypothetical protein
VLQERVRDVDFVGFHRNQLRSGVHEIVAIVGVGLQKQFRDVIVAITAEAGRLQLPEEQEPVFKKYPHLEERLRGLVGFFEASMVTINFDAGPARARAGDKYKGDSNGKKGVKPEAV